VPVAPSGEAFAAKLRIAMAELPLAGIDFRITSTLYYFLEK